MLKGGAEARAEADFQAGKISITHRGGGKLVLENRHHRQVEKSKASGANPAPGAPTIKSVLQPLETLL